MKKILLATSWFFLSFSISAEEITLAADSWMPYNGTPGDPKPGYVVEMATEIFAKKGIKVVYELVPWTRVVEGTKVGTYTGALGAGQSEIETAVLPKEPIGINRCVFLGKKKLSWSYSGLASLSDKSVGLIKDYTYDHDAFDKWASTAKSVDWASGDNALESNLKKLLVGRLDLILDDSSVLTYMVKQANLSDTLEIKGDLEKTEPLYIAFSPANPKSPQYATILSEGIKQMRASGRLKEILAGYGLKDWAK